MPLEQVMALKASGPRARRYRLYVADFLQKRKDDRLVEPKRTKPNVDNRPDLCGVDQTETDSTSNWLKIWDQAKSHPHDPDRVCWRVDSMAPRVWIERFTCQQTVCSLETPNFLSVTRERIARSVEPLP
jgi:hypothetical protein